ncbi:MAG: restriction endonuclease [Thermococcus sp.]|uniref:restriction endonuclease n=1 Tax=Thermococcus sp. TaxID=35749 RepID=UPI001D43397A|nr:restriction endonuclease [Thermococcus sp.]MBO8175585.1 restriction endonuclease [Thermococcus sp.]
MAWIVEDITIVPQEYLASVLLELLKRMGFREYEKVSNPKQWGIDIIAFRDDPISGTEKYVIKIKSGALADSRDVNVFAGIMERFKADRGIIISPVGFTKDAKVLATKEYRGRIVLWDGVKLVEILNNYGIEPDRELIKEIRSKNVKEEKKEALTTVALDAPLLFEFSPDKVFKDVVSKIKAEYRIEEREVSLKHLMLQLKTAYIFSWSAEETDNGIKDKAIVFTKDEIVPFVSRDEKLKNAVSRALLNDSSVVKVSEKNVKVEISPSEAVLLLKSRIAEELQIPQSAIIIHEKKKVYIPETAFLELEIGRSSGRAEVNLRDREIKIHLEPLPEETLIEIAKKECIKTMGEEIENMDVRIIRDRITVKGETSRFMVEIVLNIYTGKILKKESLLKEEALKKLIHTLYPSGQVVYIEKGKRHAIVDILTKDCIIILEVNLTNGEYKIVRELITPKKAAEEGKKIIEGNFPLKDLEMEEFAIVDHKYIEVTLKSRDGKAKVKVDGINGDILDYFVDISEDKARELIGKRYPEWSIKSLTVEKDSFLAEIENEQYVAKIRLSKDGKLIEEIDRYIKKNIAEKLAKEHLERKGIQATIKSLILNQDWEVEFLGEERIGTLTLNRRDGKVKKEEIWFTELAIEKMYHEHVKQKFGEQKVKTERLTHYKDKGYVTIKLSGENALYYAKINSKTGDIMEEDMVSLKGLMAKIKKLQMESKYK